MRYATLTRLATLLVLTSFVEACATRPAPVLGTPSAPVHLPAPPKFMGACPPSGAKAGDAPNQAFDLEHAAWKECSRRGAAARNWYLRLRTFYAGPKKGK